MKKILVAALAIVIGGGLFIPAVHSPAKAASTVPGVSQATKGILDPTTDKEYVVGIGQIAAIDASTGQLIKYIPIPGVINVSDFIDVSHGIQFFVNPVTNKVYILAASRLLVIDSVTDTVVQTLALANAAVATYDSSADRLYISQVDPATSQPNIAMDIMVYDGTTLAQLDVIPEALTNANGYAAGAEQLTVDSGAHRLYLVYRSLGDTATGVKVIDTTTDSVVAESVCNSIDGCGVAQLRMGGHLLGSVVSPIDGSLWISTDITNGGVIVGADNGGGGIIGGSATMSAIWRLDPVTHTLKAFSVFGLATIMGIDPATGLLYGNGSYMPLIDANTTTSISFPTTGVTNDLMTIDPNAATPIMTRVTIDGTLLAAAPGASFSCGTGTIGAFGPLAFDFGSRTIYWRCDATNTANATLVVTNMNFTPVAPGVLYPPTVNSGFVKQLSTPARLGFFNGDNFGIESNVGVLDRATVGASQLPADAVHDVFFYSQGDDIAVELNPTALTTSGVQLTAPVFIGDAPTYSVSGKITNLVGAGISGVNVTITNGTTSNVVATDASGNYTIPGNLVGTYTVSYDPTGLVPIGATSQAVTVPFGNVTGVNFQALTAPIAITSVTWSAVAGAQLNFTAGQFIPGFVQLNQSAPAGGIVVTLTSSNAKALKVPTTITIPAGSSVAGFSAQAQGVSVMTYPTVTASYQGVFAPAGTSGTSPTVTVYPSESVKVTSATWSKSSMVLTVTATDNVTFAALTVQNGKTSAIMGSMTTSGDGTYTFQAAMATPPSSVNVLSTLGAKVGQGVSTVN